jgi:DNA-directed RNA polymerase subunit RPC12/RpoP
MKDSSGNILNAEQELEQRAYLLVHAGNPCDYCGTANAGLLVTLDSGKQILMHYGMWSYGHELDGTEYYRCSRCGKVEHKAEQTAEFKAYRKTLKELEATK